MLRGAFVVEVSCRRLCRGSDVCKGSITSSKELPGSIGFYRGLYWFSNACYLEVFRAFFFWGGGGCRALQELSGVLGL